ncbi:MAG: DUF4160 domain-containing protein [Candidatus Omnitrophota bacterium]
MSPTVFYWKGYRFFFFSREEPRSHVHVSSADGEAKFWLEPTVSLAKNYGFSSSEINDIGRVVEERKHELIRVWKEHFSR